MPRIRSIKPEFWADEKLSPLAPIDRLVFLGLISMADDLGRLVDSVKQIDAMLFPFTEDSSRESLARLSRMGRIKRGVTASGQRIVELTNWHHQRVDHPNLAAALPPIEQQLEENSRDAREAFPSNSRGTPDSIYDLRSTTNDLRSPSFAPSRDDATSNGSNGAHTGASTDQLGLTVDPPSDVQVVIDHYQTVHPRRRPGPKDRKAVAKALASGYSTAELMLAIDGNARDEWHASRHKHELTYVLRDNGKIDDFRERAEASAAAGDTPLVDEFGCLTAHGELATRP
jgi:hypothetical protein